MAGIKVKLRGFLSPHLIFGLTIDSRSCGRGADSEPRRPVTNVISSLSGSLGGEAENRGANTEIT